MRLTASVGILQSLLGRQAQCPDLRAIGQTRTLELLDKETAVEILEPFQKGCSVIFTGKGIFLQGRESLQDDSRSGYLIKEEIVQLIGGRPNPRFSG